MQCYYNGRVDKKYNFGVGKGIKFFVFYARYNC